MKARRVKKLDPAGTLVRNAERIIRTRAAELAQLGSSAAADQSRVSTLHDARIAAKRLRYALDVTSALFGPAAATLHGDARRLQETLGDVHDCDVLIQRVQGRGLSSIEFELRRRRDSGFTRFVREWSEITQRLGGKIEL